MMNACLMASTAEPQRGVLASFALLLISMMLSGQALAVIDTSGSQLRFDPDKPKAGEATIDGSGNNSSKDSDIPNTVSNSGTDYSVTSIGDSAFTDNATHPRNYQ